MSAPPPSGRDGGAGRGALRRDATVVAGGQLVAVASAFVFTVVGARVLSAEDFGALVWALSWLAYLSVVSQFGLSQVATIAFATGDPVGHGPLLRRLLAAQGIGLVAVGAIWWPLLGPAAAGAGNPPEAYRPLVALVALWLPAASLGPVVVNALRARSRFGLSLVFGEHVRRILLIGALVLAASPAWSPSLSAVVGWTLAIESAIYLAGVVVLHRVVTARAGVARTGVAAGRPRSSWELLRFGSGFVVGMLASATVPQAGVWLMAAFAPVEQVAIFSVAVRIALLLATPIVIVMRTLAPRIAAAHEAGRLGELQEPIQRAASWSTVVTAAATLGLAVNGPWLLPALFGREYADALAPTLILAVGVLVNAWTGPCSVVLTHAGRSRTVAFNALVSALAFFALAAWGASVWGATGVAAAATAATSARNLHLARAASRSLGVRTIAAPGRKGSHRRCSWNRSS